MNKINYTANDAVIVKILKNAVNEDGSHQELTLAEINQLAEAEIKPGSMTSAVRKGLVEVAGEKEVSRPSKRKLATYKAVSFEILKDGKGKDYNYTDTEKSILEDIKNSDLANADNFTLAELNDVNGTDYKSGSITSLVRKGNLAKTEAVREVMANGKAKVKAYRFKADLPTNGDAE